MQQMGVVESRDKTRSRNREDLTLGKAEMQATKGFVPICANILKYHVTTYMF